MVLTNKETSVSYRCPSCGSWVNSIVGIFTITADMLKLKCPCKGSSLTLVHTNDKKIRLTVPCFVCPNPHSFTVSQSTFFDKEIFAFPCPYSGMDICFFGKEEAIKKAQDQADKELEAIAAEIGADELFGERDDAEEVLSDPQILDIVNFVVRDLDENGDIHCNCPEDEGVYSVELTGEGICITCQNCKAKALVPVTSTLTAQAFLSCDRIDLE